MAHWRSAAHRLPLVATVGGVTAIALLACGGEPTARPVEKPAAHRAAPRLIIDVVPLTAFSGPDPTWRLLADGRLESAALDQAGKPTGAWSPGPRLSADGTIHFPRPPFPQAVSARVTAGDEILPCPGQPAWGRIEGDVVTVASAGGPFRFRIDPSGTITLEGSQAAA